MKNKMGLFSLTFVLTVILLSIGYSGFTKSINVDNISATVRPIDEVRLTNLEIVSLTNGAISNYEEFNIDTITSKVVLPNKNSTVTYKVSITNFGSNDMILFDILLSSDNLDYEINDYFLKDKLCDENNNCNLGITKDIYITIKYKDNGNVDTNGYDINLNFVFELFDNTYIYDKSSNDYKLNVVGATWDSDNGIISFDGIDDYMYIENVDWDDTTAFTIDFVAKISKLDVTTPIILFESSINSNNNYRSFYVDTNEFGTNEITLAMKYKNSSDDRVNHKMVDNIIDNTKFAHYTITFDSMREYDNFTKMYFDGVYHIPTTTVPNENQENRDFANDISGEKLDNYPFYFGSRQGKNFFSKIDFKEIRIYKRALTDEEVLLNHEGNIVKDGLLIYYNFR